MEYETPKIKNSWLSRAFWDSLLFTQNKWHQHGVLLHTLRVAYYALRDKNFKMLPAALLHDVGKPLCAFKKDQEDWEFDEWSFTDHEELSYQVIKNLPFLSQYTKDLVRYHYLIRDIKKSQKEDPARYVKKKKIWESLDPSMQKDLATFLEYDDKGKGVKRR
jgi:predicted HD phosphohydrolase